MEPERNTLKPLFSWRAAIADSGLSPATRHVALALSLYMNERGGSAFPGPTLLAHDTGLHRSTVKERLGELERAGWIRCVTRGGVRGEQRTANVYEATIPETTLFASPDQAPTATGRHTRPVVSGDPSPTATRPVAHGDPNSPKNSPIKNTRERAATAAPVNSAEFDDWWEAWPKKLDKAQAKAEYTARRRQGIPAETLARAATNYVTSKAGDVQHMKYPATFLHGPQGPWSEWVDGIPPAAANSNGNGPASSPEPVRPILGRGVDAEPIWDVDGNNQAIRRT